MKRLWTARDKKGRVLARSLKPEELITFVRRLSDWAYRRLLAIHGEGSGGACQVVEVSSRVCERGTRSCVVSHDDQKGGA